MPVFIISLVIEIALIVHIVKTGRNTTWIWIVVMLPLAGAIAYLIVEVIPDIGGSRAGRKARNNLNKVFNPDKDIKEAAYNYSVSDTVENSMKLAEECLNKKMYDEARGFYDKCLVGVHEHDPHIMYGLARAEFGLGHYSKTRTVLDELIAENPEYKNADAHLLYARVLEELGEVESAIEEYEALDNYYPGPEASYRYAMLLKANGDAERSARLIDKILKQANVSGKRYNAMYEEWIKKAQTEAAR